MILARKKSFNWNPVIPEEFRKRYEEILGKDSKDLKEFLDYSKKPLRKSIRVNTIKAEVSEVKKRLEGKGCFFSRVPWCENAFFAKGIERLGKTIEHMIGLYHVQEASSMIPPVVLEPEPGERILDLCAAPGSKTTMISGMMQNKGVIIANDFSVGRIKMLRFNLNKLGCVNVVVTMQDAKNFSSKHKYDRILLDAPCSSEGMIRKDNKMLLKWSENRVYRCAFDQKPMITRAFDLLEENGVLVYSTCTLAPEENEGVITHLLEKRDKAVIEPIKVRELKSRQGLASFRKQEYSREAEKTIRVYPQDNDTEAFYIAKIRKAK